jgi:acetyltransferase-like isoleucine patch superfamily enzyme
MGNNVRIDDNAIIGKYPMRASLSIFKEDSSLCPTKIGNNCLIGANTVIYVGSSISNNALIADLASIRENTTIGEYTIVGRGVTVENYVKIGKRCKLESECYITAYSEIEDYVFIAPGVVTSNDNYLGRTEERFNHFKGVTIRKGGRIGANAVILPGTTIGEDALVAAGSVVTKDVPPRKIVMGSPARIIRDVPEEQLIENQKFYVG